MTQLGQLICPAIKKRMKKWKDISGIVIDKEEILDFAAVHYESTWSKISLGIWHNYVSSNFRYSLFF